MKKIVSVILAVALLLLSVMTLASCNTQDKTPAEKIAAGETLKVGVIQYMSHPSLDNCYEGIREALLNSGIKMDIERQTGSAASADSDCSITADNMVAAGYDIIIAIATPAAVSAFTATENTDIPVIFCAVSDPVQANLVDSNEAPGDTCTGTSDVLDLAAQLALIRAMQPDVQKIGVLYTTSEPNSLSNLAVFRTLCEQNSIELIAKGVQSAAEIPAAAADLAAQVDCINNFTDNNVVNNLSVVLTAAENNNIPVYGSEVEQVKNGCLAAVSIDYVALGKVTGDMAIEVLLGADPATMAVKTISDATPVVNTDVLAALGMTMPEAYVEIAETVTTN